MARVPRPRLVAGAPPDAPARRGRRPQLPRRRAAVGGRLQLLLHRAPPAGHPLDTPRGRHRRGGLREAMQTLPRRILVTGVAGFIGSHVAEALLRRGDHVIGLDNFDTFYDPEIKRPTVARFAD